MSPDVVVRRSCPSVSASDRAKVGKAVGLPADEIVVDLEDSVAVDEKARARSELAARMPEPTLGERTVAVRANAAGTGWCHEDAGRAR